MKAAVFKGAGQGFVVETVADPVPGPGQLVLKVHHCGICGTDLHSTEDGPACVAAGKVLGHEFCGEVVGLGAGTEGAWKEGARVAALPTIGCGTCAACLAGTPIWCRQMRDHFFGTINGGFAEYVLVGARESVRLPDSVSWQEGALVEPLAVGLHGVRLAKLDPGSDILVVGAGPVGLAVVVWARALGARTIVVTARSDRGADMARQLGATDFVTSDQDVRKAFRRIAGGPPAAVFECVGAPGMIEYCASLAAPRTEVVILGACAKPDTINPSTGMNKELTYRFALAYSVREFETAVDAIARGRIDPQVMVTDVVGFDGFPAAFEALRQRSTQCKVLFQPT
ncbi:zinc-binding dehydrogenase [Zavarzinia sp. CC-PAN008]|uniref:zinc-binding dehydrogenase n=1 Tax=Zavarzinia sp. CC-PAN008 TaxID=3243332 RepID=UPI003F747FEC